MKRPPKMDYAPIVSRQQRNSRVFLVVAILAYGLAWFAVGILVGWTGGQG